MEPVPLQKGDPLRIGRYRLTAWLGAGGMGVVYLGEADDGQRAAVKVLRPEYADDAVSRARFRREVAAQALVRSRYTMRVLDADPDSATPFLATEFADGQPLSEHVKAHGPLPPETVTRLALALAEALAAIHAAGVTHRDLKPSNVLLTDSGPMVIDFGIAQTEESASVTRTGMAVGSPGYMAPEQVTGHGGREGDVFAWALIVSFASSGQPPFGTGAPFALMHRVLDGSPDISEVPPRLLPLVTSALARDPALRPAAADLVRELSPGGVRAAPDPLPWDWHAADPRLRWRAAGSRRRRRAPAVAVSAVAALVAAGGVVLAVSGLRPGSPPPGGASPGPSATSTAPSHAGAGRGAGATRETGGSRLQVAASSPAASDPDAASDLHGSSDPRPPSGEVKRHKPHHGGATGSPAAPPTESPTAPSPPRTSAPASPTRSPASPSPTNPPTGSGAPAPTAPGAPAPTGSGGSGG